VDAELVQSLPREQMGHAPGAGQLVSAIISIQMPLGNCR
jgi:hypothetical protein